MGISFQAVAEDVECNAFEAGLWTESGNSLFVEAEQDHPSPCEAMPQENIQDDQSIVHGIVDEIISNAIEEAETSEASAGVSGSRRRMRRRRRGRGGRGQRGSRRQRGASGGRRRGRRSRVKTTDEDRKTLSKSVAGAGRTDPTFGETASEPEETITSQNAPETLATTTKPISVPVPQGISEE